jgi:Tol biopolymer transport system component
MKIKILFTALLTLSALVSAQDKKEEDSLPLEASREVTISTNEGTWMAIDVHPSGQKIVFDLLGDLYELSIQGGKATRITEGLAFDSQPKYAPDGNSILFLSDRSGGNNVWIIDQNEKDTLQITKGNTSKMQSADWSPDGDYIVVSQGTRNFKLHLYHKDGGGGSQFISEPERLKISEPTFSADGRLIWFSERMGAWQYNAKLPQYQLGTYDREDGKKEVMTSRYGSAFTPTLSPDGKWLVYGSRFNDQTGLIKRNLLTQEEDWLAYPVQRDEQESIAPLGVLPAMSFTPDSKAIVASYGGKIYRIPINGDQATNIPFEVNETITMAPQLKFDYPIDDSATFSVNQIRDAQISPDGSSMVFTALNQLYHMSFKDKKPRRLTEHSIMEAMPTWHPNGKEVAFVTWDQKQGGNVYKIRTDKKAKPVQLTQEIGVYTQPVWSADNRIIVFKGSAQQFMDADGPRAFQQKSNLVWLSGNGPGKSNLITKAAGLSNPHFAQNDNRIYLNTTEGLISIKWDGTDQKQHLQVDGITVYGSSYNENHLLADTPSAPKKKPSKASILLRAPKGSYALAQINNDIYVVTLPYLGNKGAKINVKDASKAAFPSRKLTKFGGQFPSWDPSGEVVYWTLGKTLFRYDIAKAELEEKAQKEEAEAKKKAKEEKEETEEEVAVTGEDEEDEEEDVEEYQAKELDVIVKAKRAMAKGLFAMTNATIITMEGKQIIENGTVLIRDNRIESIGTISDVSIPENAKIIDLEGKYLLPGFVDTHAHMWPAWGLHKKHVWVYAANLAYGVTTTRDPQTATTDVLTYADMVEAGMIPGPRIYSTGPGVGYWGYNIKSLDHARDVLTQYSKYYNTKTIKMYLTGNRQHRQWIIQAAKEQKLMPTTEGGLDFKLNLTQILDGYPGHEHSFPVYPLYKDFIDFVSASQTAYTPTLLVSYGGPWAENYFYATEDVQGDPKINRFTPKSELDAKSRRRNAGWFMEEEHVFEDHAVFVKDLVEAGGIAGVGSHGQLQGLGYHWELWSMHSGGISNHDMLKVATLLGAKALGLSKDLGSIAKGKIADLVVLEKNPLKNIRHTNTVTHVVKNGFVYDAETLDKVHPTNEKQDYPWKQAAPSEQLPGIKK